MWEIGQILFIVVWVICIRKFRLSGQFSAYVGFGFLIVTLIFNLIRWDDAASLSAQYVFILFSMSFIQEFYHFLKHENK